MTKLERLISFLRLTHGSTAAEIREKLGETEYMYVNSYYGYVERNRCRPEYIHKFKLPLGKNGRMIYTYRLTAKGFQFYNLIPRWMRNEFLNSFVDDDEWADKVEQASQI